MIRRFRTLLATALCLTSSLSAGSSADCRMTEFGIGTGFIFGDMVPPQNDWHSIPLFFRVGIRLNEFLSIENHSGQLQLVTEPFLNPIFDPRPGVEVGFNLFLNYSYPIHKKVNWILEAGSGPAYQTIDTIEQSSAGFLFVNQAGSGFQYFFRENETINITYRYRHASHGGLRSGANGGIDTHAIILGWSRHY